MPVTAHPTELAILAVFGFFVGACFGSFFSMAAHRYPLMVASKLGRVQSDREAVFNLAWPPSHCPVCLARLRWWQNLPLISWLILRGECGHCHVKIPARYLLLEATGAGIGLLSALIWGWEAYIPAIALLGGLGVAMLEHRLRRNMAYATLALAGVGLALSAVGWGAVSAMESIVGLAAGVAVFLAIESVQRLIRRVPRMPTDTFFFASVGAWGGIYAVPLVSLVATFLILVRLLLPSKSVNPTPYFLFRFTGWALVFLAWPYWVRTLGVPA